ncbi:MAG: DUF4105 domain-containing protein, partial [Proteobacteria bacterium]|nr:DUF4105 domain-containing protein [Pseudomonadota bacterium]
MLRTALIIIFCLALLTVKPACATMDLSYQKQLINQAQQMDLAHDKQWLNMVYYEKNRFGAGYESLFDSDNFFLAKGGKHDPQKELEATIISFFSDEELPFENVFKKRQTAQCAFKGRYEWLKKKLAFNQSKLRELPCADFETWYQKIDPHSATLIFAASYLNNPASMFGHTFLLINRDGKQHKILSKAVNYSADTDETNGIIFSYKGIFGLYEGRFSILDYHKMIKKYNNAENRDIWEYDLNLSAQDLLMMMANLWEINNSYADYYFFSENCSYLLLKMLQIVRSDITYKKPAISAWVIPSDTVIEISKTPNLIKETRYRPSRASNIKHLMDNADKRLLKLAHRLAKNEDIDDALGQLSENQRKLAYDLAYEYVQYMYQKSDDMSRLDMANLSLKLLRKRSEIAGTTDLKPLKIPNSNPVFAHDTKRISLLYGHNHFRKEFVQLNLRPAYHDLMDNGNGFLKGAQINLMDLGLRYYHQSDSFRLNHLNIVDIKSYSARSFLFKPLSWELNIG